MLKPSSPGIEWRKRLRARNDSPGMGLGLSLIANACDVLSLDGGRSGGTVVRMTFLR